MIYFENIINDLPLGFIIVDDKFKIKLWNKYLEEISGIRQVDIIGKNLFDEFPHLNFPKYFERLKNVFAIYAPAVFSAYLHKYIIPCKLPDGSFRYQHTTVNQIKDPLATDKLAVFMIQDVTDEIKRAEEYKRMHRVALEEIRIRTQTEAALKKLNADKDRFVSIMAHDIKNPLASIMAFAQIISEEREELSQEELEQFSDNIHVLSKGLLELLEQLLTWGRLQLGKIEYSPEEFDIIKLIEHRLVLYRQDSIKKRIKILFDYSGSGEVFADKNMVDTVLRNLLSNAIKFTKSEGTIKVRSISVGNKALVEVEDNGIGIAEEVLSKLFRIDITVTTKGTNNESGTGLGLILCKEMVETNKGELFVSSIFGEGTKFSFTLPKRIFY